MKKKALTSLVTVVVLLTGFICRSEVKIAFFAPTQQTQEIEEKISKCFEKVRNIKFDKISKITSETLQNYQVLILWATRNNAKNKRKVNRLDENEVKIVRTWVENGGGLLCFHDAVGLKKHDSESIFPEAGMGIDNYYPDRNPFVRECIVTRSHPLVKGIAPNSRFVVSYFDFVTIEPGGKGVPVARRVTKSPMGGIVDDPVLVVAEIGKGRYVACGFASGLHASNTPAAPIGPEFRIMSNAINWLADKSKTPAVSEETVQKGQTLKPRNLVNNSSMEIVENNFPVGWGKARASGEFEWGVSDTEKHSGKYSVYVTAKDYYTDPQSGRKGLGGGISTCKGSWQTKHSDCIVRPNTEYKFSFWMKTNAPYIRMWTSQFTSDKKAMPVQPTSHDWMKPIDDKWHKYEGKFITGPNTNSLILSFYITGRKEKWGRNSGIPLGTTMYLDDVEIKESASVSPIAELKEQNFVRMKDAVWKKSTGAPPRLMTIAPETPLKFNEEYLEFPAFKNLPRGSERIDLNGLWKIKKFYGQENAETNGPGLKGKFWTEDLKDDNWAQRYVPSCWYSDDTPEKSRKSGALRRAARTMLKTKPAPWVGWYRKEFELPEIEKGKRTILNFERVSYKCEVWVNGKKIGKHTGGRTPFKFDITDAVKSGGKNVVAVRIFDPIKIYDWGHWTVGGIWDVVYLDIVPAIYSHRTLITPELKKSQIEVEAWINNTTGKECSPSLSAVVKSYSTPYAKGASYDKTTVLGKQSLKPGMNKCNFTIPMESPIYWTPENPYLYTLELKAGDEFISKNRYGFRSFIAKGPDFLLNGKPLYLRGECFNFSHHRFRPGLINPVDKEFIFMKKFLMAKRELNTNNIYAMVTPLPHSLYNLLDEIGITLYVDWHAAQACYPRNEPIESEEDLKEMEVWVYDAYNHPSQAMWSLGGELYEHYHPKFVKTYDELLNPLYDMIKRLDKQNRPVCNSSGRIPNKDSKTDIWDDHAYPGAIAGSWTQEDDIIDVNINSMRKLYGKKRIPFIQYEVGGFSRIYNSDWKACQKAGFKADNDWDKEKFIKIAQNTPLFWYGLRQTSGIYGTRRWLKDMEIFGRYGVGNQKMMIKGVLGMSRCSGLMAGIGANVDPFAFVEILDEKVPHLINFRSFFRGHYEKGDLSKKIFVASEGFEDMKRVYNPALICWLLYPKNNFAGREFSATTYVVNDTGRELKDLSARVVVKDKSGKVVSDTTAKIDNVPYYKRVTFPYKVKLPMDLKTGDYRAELFLYEKDQVISDGYYELYILGGDDWNTPIATTKKVAVFDKGKDVLGEKCPNTCSVLKDLKVPFTDVKDFKNLSEYDVLIIGAYSMSPLMTSGNEINEWLNNGGRLLVFEQMVPGPVPFLPQLQIIRGYPNISADIVTITHPVFKDLSLYNFFRWNGNAPGVNNCPGAIFSCAIKPLNKTMVMVGATAVPRNSLKALSMLLSDVKVGKGMVALNQLEATSRYGNDSAATQYIRNLVKYVLSDETKYSTPLDIFSLGKVNLNECGLVDLGKGQRWKINGLCFDMPDKGIDLNKGQTVNVDLTKNVFYDPEFEAKYDAEHVDEGGLQHDVMEKVFFLYGCDSIQTGKTAAVMTVRYVNGGTQKIKLTGGVNIEGAKVEKNLPLAVYAGKGLFITSWQNPYPGTKIKSLEVVGLNAKGFKLKGITGKLIRERTHK